MFDLKQFRDEIHSFHDSYSLSRKFLFPAVAVFWRGRWREKTWRVTKRMKQYLMQPGRCHLSSHACVVKFLFCAAAVDALLQYSDGGKN